MKILSRILLFLFLCSPLFSQTTLATYDPQVTLTADQCYDVIKTTWDELKKYSEEYTKEVAEKNEFESSTEFSERVQRAKENFVGKITKFTTTNKLGEKTFSVWLKAELIKYDADNQVYSVKSPTEILIQPKKNEIVVTCPANKYVAITEKNAGGYRRANLRLNTDPEFSWFVNKQTAQSAKNKEQVMFFKLSFTLNASVNESNNQVVLQVVPMKLALMDQGENFTYWSEEIR